MIFLSQQIYVCINVNANDFRQSAGKNTFAYELYFVVRHLD